jgi:hypothetical protein
VSQFIATAWRNRSKGLCVSGLALTAEKLSKLVRGFMPSVGSGDPTALKIVETTGVLIYLLFSRDNYPRWLPDYPDILSKLAAKAVLYYGLNEI